MRQSKNYRVLPVYSGSPLFCFNCEHTNNSITTSNKSIKVFYSKSCASMLLLMCCLVSANTRSTILTKSPPSSSLLRPCFTDRRITKSRVFYFLINLLTFSGFFTPRTLYLSVCAFHGNGFFSPVS